MKKYILFFIAITLFAACKKPIAEITQFTWLEGRWEGVEGDMQTFEEWEPLKNNVIQGVGGLTSEEDTIFAETIKIELIEGDLFYVAAVPGNSNPVAFKLIKFENNTATFENLKHDFPQRVIYSLKADGSLYARIEGNRSGKESKQEFYFNRVK